MTMPRKLTDEEYDQKLARFGKALRLDKYVNQSTPILHRCLIHGEEHLARPGDLSLGHGMKCCGRVLHDEAKSKYDLKLKAIGLVKRVDPYVTRRKEIRHRCLKHGTVFLQEPRRALEGRIPPCCARFSSGSLYSLLLSPKRWGSERDAIVYLFRLARFTDHVKIGITTNIAARIDDEYGDFVCYWPMPSKFHALLVEQASLGDTSMEIHCPTDLRVDKWPGNTEVRRVENQVAISLIQFYVDELERLGVYKFILSYLDPSDAVREICETNALA